MVVCYQTLQVFELLPDFGVVHISESTQYGYQIKELKVIFSINNIKAIFKKTF